MANTKKYVSLDKLGLYDEKIKKVITDGDTAALDSAKSYADGLAVNYDAAGSAATVQGKLDEEIARAKAKEDEIVAANVATQKEVDDLEKYVGTLPEGTAATSVVDYVNVKTAGIATDAALGELNNQVSALQGAVNGITADYLKGADKTELSGAIKAEEDRAKGVESGLRTDVDAIKGDYLKAADAETLQGNIDAVVEDVAEIAGDYLKGADKTELEGKIGAKADQTALDAEIERATGVEASLQTQINTIMNNPDTEGVINSITEFTQYIADHGEIAEGFRADIDKNKEDIAANAKAIEDKATSDAATYATKTELANEKKALQDEIDSDVAVVDGRVATLEGTVATKADKTYVDEQVQALQGVDTGLGNRITALENKFGGAEGSVEDMIADAQAAAEATAAADATAKANAAEAAAKGHADSLNTAMNTRVEALEAIDHDHSNKAELDLIASGDKAKWDEAAGKAHEHSNFSVLEGITSGKVTAWDNAESKAKEYADGLNTAMDTRVASLESWHNNFTEVSEQEINDLFA